MSKEMNPEVASDLSELVDHCMIRYGAEFCPFFVDRGKGSYVYDPAGRPILDFTSGQMCSILGHNHPAILAAMRESMETILHLFSAMLAAQEKICSLRIVRLCAVDSGCKALCRTQPDVASCAREDTASDHR